MSKPKRNVDAQLHMSATYTRHSKPKRTFSLVIKGIMLSSVMLSNIAMGGVSAFAATSPDLPTHPISAPTSQQIQVQEDALVKNLRLAIKAIEEIGWSQKTLQVIAENLHAIDDKLTNDIGYKFTLGLKDAVVETKLVMSKFGGDGLTELRGKGNSINETLQSIEMKLGTLTPSNIASPPPVDKKAKVRIASAAENEVSVVIDGQVQAFPQPAVTIKGSTMVPMRAIFEKLGAEIKWNGETRTVTATKGNTVIILTLDRDIAIINGNPVKLTAKAQSINGNTMVPLRFVSEALGAAVKWDGVTRTAYIDSAGTSDAGQTQLVDGIKVKYGKHTYGSRDQSEYDTVVRIAEKALAGYDESKFGGSDHEYYLEYLDGARWSGNKKDRSARNIGLYYAEAQLGDLVKDGVSKEEIIKVRTLASIAYDLLDGATDPRDGSPRSAYDALAASPRITDCDSDAQVFSLVFDMMGYNTMIGSSPNHAQMYVEIDGRWYSIISGVFTNAGTSADISNFLKDHPDRGIHTQPTYGPPILY